MFGTEEHTGADDFRFEHKEKSMYSLTYKDIIDEKITEWQSRLEKLEEEAGKASSDTQTKLKEKMAIIKSAIDTARVQLHWLDEQETVGNTVETKDKILKIFNSIDKDFPKYEEQTPYML